MSRIYEIYSLGVVITGNFNPVIVTPQWLALKGFIRESESEAAIIDVIHPDLTRFELDWLRVEITQERLDFSTTRESHFIILKDLIVSVFNTLKETPVTAFGINHMCHYSLRNLDEYMKFGYWLSPVELFSEVLSEPRLHTIQIVESEIKDQDDGLIKFNISPSTMLTDKKSVLFYINHHFENEKKGNADYLIGLMLKKWDYSFEKVQKLMDTVWDKAKI